MASMALFKKLLSTLPARMYLGSVYLGSVMVTDVAFSTNKLPHFTTTAKNKRIRNKQITIDESISVSFTGEELSPEVVARLMAREKEEIMTVDNGTTLVAVESYYIKNGDRIQLSRAPVASFVADAPGKAVTPASGGSWTPATYTIGIAYGIPTRVIDNSAVDDRDYVWTPLGSTTAQALIAADKLTVTVKNLPGARKFRVYYSTDSGATWIGYLGGKSYDLDLSANTTAVEFLTEGPAGTSPITAVKSIHIRPLPGPLETWESQSGNAFVKDTDYQVDLTNGIVTALTDLGWVVIMYSYTSRKQVRLYQGADGNRALMEGEMLRIYFALEGEGQKDGVELVIPRVDVQITLSLSPNEEGYYSFSGSFMSIADPTNEPYAPLGELIWSGDFSELSMEQATALVPLNYP